MSIALKRPVADPVSSAAREHSKQTARVLEPTVPARVAARLRGGRLDRALISGADPSRSGILAARVLFLTSSRSRASLADALRNLATAGHGPRRRWWALGWTAAVDANAAQLRELAELLESDAPLYAGGIASLNELLSDGAGPAYRGDAPALARALSDARELLES